VYLPEVYHLVRWLWRNCVSDAGWYQKLEIGKQERKRKSGGGGGGRGRFSKRSGGSGRSSKKTIARRDDEIALRKLRTVLQDQTAKRTGSGSGSGSGSSSSDAANDLVGGKYGHLSYAFMK